MLTFTLIWVILNEKLGWQQLLTGFFLSLAMLAFTNNQLLMDDYSQIYSIRFFVLLRYFFYLIIEIYRSGFTAIARIIKGHDAVQMVTYQSSLDGDFALTLLANAITLTPGTVTVDMDRQMLQILRFDPLPDKRQKLQPENGHHSIRVIEKILRNKS